ncbi:MAG: hypothetical protein GXP60_05205 [Epsilonproteobacteria bacterium]|nr:hypothetical protein [Campylobacterota bacterium]
MIKAKSSTLVCRNKKVSKGINTNAKESELMRVIRLSGVGKITIFISILGISKILACKLETIETNRFHISNMQLSGKTFCIRQYGRQKQGLAVAETIIGCSKIILANESTSALGPKGIAK